MVRNVQIPLKFRCRYITSSCALHLLTCMLVRSCWHKKSWSYFDNFNEVFNACFVCVFCLVNYKKKKKKKKKAMNSHYTIRRATLQPHLKFRKSFSIGGYPPLSPTQYQHQHKNPVGPTKDISSR